MSRGQESHFQDDDSCDEKTVTMPSSLTAENGAKGLMSGEFFTEITETCELCEGDGKYDMEECGQCHGTGESIRRTTIDWSTIKEIYAKAVKHLAV